MSIHTATILLIIASCIWTFIATPLSCYYTWRFWQFHKQSIPFFSKRHPKLVILSVIGFALYPAIIRPIIEYTRCRYTIIDNCNTHWYNIPLAFIPQICIALVVARLWLLYYDYKHKLNTLKSQFKNLIVSDQMQDILEDWTITYKWSGNVRIITSITLSVSSFLILLSAIFGIQWLKYTQFLPTLWIIAILILVVKIRSCRDEFYIKSLVINDK